jgi:hypothetical protein
MLYLLVTYAGEVLGLYYATLVKALQNVADRGLKITFGLKETSSRTIPAVLYRQAGIPPVHASMSAMQYRAYMKFPSLSTWAMTLGLTKSKAKGSWHRQSAYHVESEARDIDPNLTPKAKVKALRTLNMWEKSEKMRSVTQSVSWQKYEVMHRTNEFVKELSFSPAVIRGTPILAAARMNAMWTAKKAADARLIDDERWKNNRCPCCSKNTPETIEHILLKCNNVKRWSAARKVMTNKINCALQKNGMKINWQTMNPSTRVTILLGGVTDECDLALYWLEGFRNQVAKEPRRKSRCGWKAALYTYYVAEYLASIQEERDKYIWVHYVPIESRHQNGMADLASDPTAPVTDNDAT